MPGPFRPCVAVPAHLGRFGPGQKEHGTNSDLFAISISPHSVQDYSMVRCVCASPRNEPKSLIKATPWGRPALLSHVTSGATSRVEVDLCSTRGGRIADQRFFPLLSLFGLICFTEGSTDVLHWEHTRWSTVMLNGEVHKCSATKHTHDPLRSTYVLHFLFRFGYTYAFVVKHTCAL